MDPPQRACLRCGLSFATRNKLMRHLFPSSTSDPSAQPCSGAPVSRSDRQVQQRRGSDLSFSGPRQTNHCPSQASLSPSQPSAVTSLPRSQQSHSEGQSLHPSPPLFPGPVNAVGTQLNASVGGGDRGDDSGASGSGVLPRTEVVRAFELWKDVYVKEWKEISIEETSTASRTGSTMALPRPPSSSCSDSGTDNGIPITPQSTAGHANDSSDDPDGHLDCCDRSTCETSPGQGRHHCGSGINNGGYASVHNNNDGDTEELCHGSSYEDEDSGDNCSDGPDDHPTGYVEDCFDYGNEDYGGYDDHNDYDGHDDDDDYYD